MTDMREALAFLSKAKEVLSRRFPRCRDCADEDGTCPSSGLPCDLGVAFGNVREALSASEETTEQAALREAVGYAEAVIALNAASPPQESVGVGVQDTEAREVLREIVSEIRAYQSPECDDEGALGADLLKRADAILSASPLPPVRSFDDTFSAVGVLRDTYFPKDEHSLNPPSYSAVEAEAERMRIILDTEPPNDNSDMLYAAYNALLFVLGYGVHSPSELWGTSSDERRERWLNRAKLPDDRRQNQSTRDGD